MSYSLNRTQFSPILFHPARDTADGVPFPYATEQNSPNSPHFHRDFGVSMHHLSLYDPTSEANMLCLNCGRAGHSVANCHSSPSASPTGSAFTMTSAPDPYRLHSVNLVENRPEPHYTYETGQNNFLQPRSLLRSQDSHPSSPDVERPTRHEIFERKTGEEELFNKHIHRLSDEERRGFAPTHRPTFICLYQHCNRHIMNRAQVKPHLVEQHGILFQKPFCCTCGAEFGRAVEAARHVEDKKPCELCNRSGRKSRGSTICLRCCRSPYGGIDR